MVAFQNDPINNATSCAENISLTNEQFNSSSLLMHTRDITKDIQVTSSLCASVENVGEKLQYSTPVHTRRIGNVRITLAGLWKNWIILKHRTHLLVEETKWFVSRPQLYSFLILSSYLRAGSHNEGV